MGCSSSLGYYVIFFHVRRTHTDAFSRRRRKTPRFPAVPFRGQNINDSLMRVSYLINSALSSASEAEWEGATATLRWMLRDVCAEWSNCRILLSITKNANGIDYFMKIIFTQLARRILWRNKFISYVLLLTPFLELKR